MGISTLSCLILINEIKESQYFKGNVELCSVKVEDLDLVSTELKLNIIDVDGRLDTSKSCLKGGIAGYMYNLLLIGKELAQIVMYDWRGN